MERHSTHVAMLVEQAVATWAPKLPTKTDEHLKLCVLGELFANVQLAIDLDWEDSEPHL